MGSLSHFFAILLKPREILLNEAHEAKIDEHQFHGGVANAFTEGICGGVNLVCAASHSRKRIRDRKPAIVVAVPVDANFFAGWFHDLVDGELHKVERTIWRGVADGVAENNGARTVSNGRGVQPLHGIGISANGVFRDIHGRKSVLDRELYCFFGSAFEVIDRPIFHQPADGTAAEKCSGFNRYAHALRNFDNRTNVIFMRARRAIGLDFHPVRGDFPCQCFGMRKGTRPCARQSDIDCVDSKRFHQMQDFDFFFNAGVEHGWILQAVAQRFVIQ